MMIRFLKCILIILGMAAPTGAGEKSQELPSPSIPKNVDEDGLPTDPTARDNLLKTFYKRTIPLLYASIPPNTYGKDDRFWLPSNKFSYVPTLTPYPYNPYREPTVTKRFFLPSHSAELHTVIRKVEEDLDIHKKIVHYINVLLKKIEPKLQQDETILIDGINYSLIKSLFVTPPRHDVKVYTLHSGKQLQAIHSPLEKNKLLIKKGDIRLLKRLGFYHKAQINKLHLLSLVIKPIQEFSKGTDETENINRFFQTLYTPSSPKYSEAKRLFNALKPYFLSGKIPAHKLINVEAFQKNVPHREVIVLDSKFSPSKYLNIGDQLAPPSSSYKSWQEKMHGTAVAGIIGASEELQHLKGVAPGVKTILITIDEIIDKEVLEKIANSNARVINISLGFKWPKSCFLYFKKKLSKRSPPQVERIKKEKAQNDLCSNYWKFAELIKNKDMLIVKAAGNEGFQIEEISWSTGKRREDFSNRAPGMQYQGILQHKKNGSTIPFVHIYQQIPQLKDRVIVVGNLFPDGVTIAPNSSLPGAIFKHFIFAPSETIGTLHPEIIGKDLKKRNIYSEVGAFGGTSGAAPRVAGVFVLLERLFPSHSMTVIRNCVLETGDPFWQDPKNKHTWIKNYATSPYGQRIFGQGRINAMKAYQLCHEKQEKRDKLRTRSAINIQ